MKKAGKAIFEGRGSQHLGNQGKMRCWGEDHLEGHGNTRMLSICFSSLPVNDERNPHKLVSGTREKRREDRGLAKKITYGGRVTDAWDKWCLTAILGRLFLPATLEEGSKFRSFAVSSGKCFHH
ncbi:uncharacterized protein [Montipora capricornis]|uniref:uncharacterized protein n=1 Tax=Montipora capricornis TaxID=246305 RepID=UPI0035F1854B